MKRPYSAVLFLTIGAVALAETPKAEQPARTEQVQEAPKLRERATHPGNRLRSEDGHPAVVPREEKCRKGRGETRRHTSLWRAVAGAGEFLLTSAVVD